MPASAARQFISGGASPRIMVVTPSSEWGESLQRPALRVSLTALVSKYLRFQIENRFFSHPVVNPVSSRAMSPPTSTEAIKYDLSCPRCGYNLRGLSPTGMCPECAQAIRFALREKLLRYADPNWIRAIRLGVVCEMSWLVGLPVMLIVSPINLWWSVVVAVINCFLFSAAGFFLSASDSSSTPKIIFGALRIFTLFGLAGGLGWILALTPFGASIPGSLCSIAALLFGPALLIKIHLTRRYAQRLISWDIAQLFALAIWMGGLSASVGILLLLSVYFQADIGVFLGVVFVVILVLVTWLSYLCALAELNGSIGVELDAARMRS